MKHNCEDTRSLLSGYLNGDLTQGDRQRVEVILEDCPDCAAAFADMKSRRTETGGLEDEPRTEAERQKAAPDSVTETGGSIGQILVIAGFILFYGGAIYLGLGELLADKETPMILKIGLPVLLLGLGILLISVLIQRLKAAKTDPYKDVEI